MSKPTQFEIGKRYFYQDTYGSFIIGSGVVLRTTAKFCVLELGNGREKRKAKHLLFESEDVAKLSIIKKVDDYVQEIFGANILELSKLFKEMLEKYPEKFV